MESYNLPPSTSLVKCCDCGCSCSVMNRSPSETYLRSVKRKYVEFEGESQFTIPGFTIPQNARVEIENECTALRETVSSQQQTIQDLICELEEERNASSSAANEAMSMILRLQREKAEIQMEAKQFKRFAEEKMAHDQQEMSALEELLYKREHAIESLTFEVQAYKHRMMSYGLTEAEVDEIYVANGERGMTRNTSMTANLEGQSELRGYEIYPPLKCNINESQFYPDCDDKAADIEQYAYGETPYSRDQLKDLEYRINQLEKTPRTIQPDKECVGANDVFDKVIVGQSLRRPLHITDNSNSPFVMSKEMGPDYAADSPVFGGSIKKTEHSHLDVSSNFRKVENASEVGDDVSDRVYTIDSIHRRASVNGVMDYKASVGIGGDDYVTTPKDSQNHSDVKDLEIQKLYARLHALEADRETMRQAIISVGTDKAQMELLKEIAQNFCKEMSSSRGMLEQKKSVVTIFSFISVFKWIVAFVFWKRKASRCRYAFGLSTNNAGLLSLLDQGSHVGQRRSISSTKL